MHKRTELHAESLDRVDTRLHTDEDQVLVEGAILGQRELTDVDESKGSCARPTTDLLGRRQREMALVEGGRVGGVALDETGLVRRVRHLGQGRKVGERGDGWWRGRVRARAGYRIPDRRLARVTPTGDRLRPAHPPAGLARTPSRSRETGRLQGGHREALQATNCSGERPVDGVDQARTVRPLIDGQIGGRIRPRRREHLFRRDLCYRRVVVLEPLFRVMRHVALVEPVCRRGPSSVGSHARHALEKANGEITHSDQSQYLRGA
jgi:hypothetical protein